MAKYRITPFVAAICGLMLMTPFLVSANTVLRTGDEVNVSADQRVEGDFYATAATISMSGEVSDDMYVAAGTVTMNGSVGADVFVLAGSVQMHASVTDDVRIVAGEVTIAEQVEGDLVVIGGTLKVLSSGAIAGDILFFGAEAEIAGSVGGNIMGAAETVRLDAPVGGNVDIRTANLTLGERADIAGDVRYISASELRRAPGAVVAGEVTRNAVDTVVTPREQLRAILLPLFILIFAALTLFLFFRAQVAIVIESVGERFWVKSLIGLSTIIATPFIVILLFVTGLGALIAVLLLCAYLTALMLSLIMAPIFIGSYLFKHLTQWSHLTIVSIVVGAIALELALLVPVVGSLLLIMTMSAVIGSGVVRMYRALSV